MITTEIIIKTITTTMITIIYYKNKSNYKEVIIIKLIMLIM